MDCSSKSLFCRGGVATVAGPSLLSVRAPNFGSTEDFDWGAIEKELGRLSGLGGKKMAPEQATWLSARINLLNKMKVEL